MEISIIGAGSWASAIACVLAENNKVLMYARNEKDVNNINNKHINKKYFPNKLLNKNIRATDNIEDLFRNKILINAIPTQAIREVLEGVKEKLSNKILINLSKGIEIKTYKRISEIIEELNSKCQYAVLSGPSHAEEVIDKMPTALVCASKNQKIALNVQDLFTCDYLRVYTSDDVIGVEIGGAIKNVLAFGIGMATGLKFGDNTKAAIMTRGIFEMNKFAISHGASSKTINGLCGIGDLIVTATSNHSRNNRCGILVGKGYSLDEAMNEVKTVVEGIPTTRALYELSNKEGLDLPITTEIYRVLYEGQDPSISVKNLMNRDKKSEY
ncbi:NAD(P)-dependent glycerol-3-phosphate dehydrogenase [Anaerococcus sp. AGMB00486]|uniref:Glycerol-3-phosphate dehydrogenase [NAD(P)+] n=2 Tax=Anaerococcus TaxID=165779 RepID=A0ABX2N7X9_9FIRM|nr:MULTISPECIES: NAD(P)H-dependent glycerol-3-phosphate dehydrogenase [Anaerococcus]MDY3005456.1 NAD(P)H-dependent glycerol-3-phosphate dehydrogenase [Anaerococcus porci]MSS76884.1 NAD(P)-dependent glycerol-3-phosphate dehydrogenase [Anaerococcus porci]NVF10632.1 NAD(P)-dependent glycerol-3-phosphate dehydrogenase [Anaerococcus faecalis]